MPHPPTVLIIACGAIAHELAAVISANALQHVQIRCLPAQWHNTPERIAPGVEEKILALKDQFDRIIVAYGDCGTGGQLDKVLERFGIERLPGPHCYSFFSGQQVFDQLAADEPGTFYLTDFLVDHFDRLILQELGIIEFPQLRDVYFGNYTTLVYLCQSTDAEAKARRTQMAQQAATALGLRLTIHHTGLQPFEHALRTIHIAAA